MQVISASSEVKSTLKSLQKLNKTIGLVPTMGALHEGHLGLIKTSLEGNDLTVVSIFVNPLQFDKKEDLTNYPRDLEEDLRLLSGLGVDFVFNPTVEDLYPSPPKVSIKFGEMSAVLEGKYRKGHFDGVGIVVAKLLNLVQPDHAYFGLKDLQQYSLIKNLCNDLNFQTRIVGVETVREESGLAMSSRNRRLSKDGKDAAKIIYQGLKGIKEGIEKRMSLSDLLLDAKRLYSDSSSFELEYLEAVNAANLESAVSLDSIEELAVCVAGYVEGIRLIDNLYLRLK